MEREKEDSSSAQVLKRDVQELIERVESADSEQLRQLVRKDPDFTRELLSSFPSLVNAASQVMIGMTAQLEEGEAEAVMELLAGSVFALRGEELGEAINGFCRLMIKMYELRPDMVNRQKLEVISDAINATDWGKVRKYLTCRVEARSDYYVELIDLIGDQPLALINILNVVPEYIDLVSKVLATVFDALVLPSEAMTYALWKVLQEVDWSLVAQAVNGGFRFINIVNRGDLILGEGGSRYAAVVAQMSEDFTGNLDWEEARNALIFVSGVLETTVNALTDSALSTEEGLRAATGVAVSVANAYVGSASHLLRRLSELPTERVRGMGADIGSSLNAAETGRAINSLLVLFNRLCAENGSLFAEVVGGTMSEVEARQAVMALGNALGQANMALAEGNTLEGLSLPELVGEMANSALGSYNRFSQQEPELIAKSIDRFAATLDYEQVSLAASHVSAQITEAAVRNPRMAFTVFRAFFKAAYDFMKTYVRRSFKSRWGREESRVD